MNNVLADVPVPASPHRRPAHAAAHGRWAGVVRAWFWRLAWWLCGGLRVDGQAPTGPAVLVANHRSHADSAALLAALPAGREVVFAAAADYWRGSAVRRATTATFVPALPVARSGGGAYAQLRAAARPVLARGGVVVVYPEGTRCGSSTLGSFKAGAIRLAQDAGVPLVAAAIDGTQHVLPKRGQFRPGPVGVRFGRPMDERELAALTAEQLRDRVSGLLQVVGSPSPSRAWSRVAGCLRHPLAPLLTFMWGFAEALSWPVIAELALVVFAVAMPSRLWRHAAYLLAGSVAGILVHAWLAGHGITLPMPLTTAAMQTEAATNLVDGPWGLMHQAFSGVPVKVYAAQAGSDGLQLGMLARVAVIERGLRIVAVTAALSWTARWLIPLLRRYYGSYLLIVAALFVAAESRVIAYWS